ncbi:histidine phosphatase family protein [Paenibacillus dendritiformis]|uniref:histidine phosphatase family protein n=1 Tax=Paenibacillus dendritiformis TaxID=130049 RepID=UPI00248C030B|nr:histidine phosphatase family protein [Paenibacillus dendritiformis]WGU96626.1 histidine phosphatase family protein [Paenibacillus dendritiformis]
MNRENEPRHTVVIFIRHAESEYAAGRERERGLTEQGMKDARRVSETLAMEPIDHVYSSPYARAILTVQALADARGLTVRTVDELHERRIAGDDHPLNASQFFAAKRRALEDFTYAEPGGESSQAAQSRAVPSLLGLIRRHEAQRIAIGTHGDIMTLMMNYFDSVYGYDFWKATSMPDIYRCTFRGGNLVEVERMWK